MGTQKVSEQTVTQLITKARYTVNDSRAPYYQSDIAFLEWFNEGHRQAALDSRCVQNTETITLAANTVRYTCTNRYLSIHAVHYINSAGTRKALLPGGLDRVGLILEPGEPAEFTDFDGYLYVYPSLSAVTSETVEAFQSQRTWPDKDYGDQLDTPGILDNAIVWYMVQKYYWSDDKNTKAEHAKRKYDIEVLNARRAFYPGFNGS